MLPSSLKDVSSGIIFLTMAGKNFSVFIISENQKKCKEYILFWWAVKVVEMKIVLGKWLLFLKEHKIAQFWKSGGK